MRRDLYQIRMISLCSHGLWPPMEVRLRADHLWCALESEAVLPLHVLPLIEGMEMAIC